MSTVMTSLFALLVTGAAAPLGYHVLKTIPVPGNGGWDYLAVDESARRVYISHATQVDVLDADSGAPKGTIPDTRGVHGVALASDLGHGFISNGQAGTVTVLELKTLKVLGALTAGKNPNAIVYEPVNRRVLAFNGGTGSATVIDAAARKVVATLNLGGQPEFGVADGAGHLLVVVNADSGKVVTPILSASALTPLPSTRKPAWCSAPMARAR